MEKLNLSNSIKQLRLRKLIEIYGETKLEMISQIFDKPIIETTLVEMLKLRFGNQILSQKKIRLPLLDSLKMPYKQYIENGNFIDEALDEKKHEAFLNLKWGRNSKKVDRVLEVFELDETYLLPIYEDLPDNFLVEPDITLYPYQRRVKDRLTRALIKDYNRILLHMPTGSGKTRTSIEALIDYWRTYSDRNGFILWLAHSEELCEQAVETFEKIWRIRGDSPITIYRLWGRHKLPDFGTGSGIIVASFQTLYSLLITSENEKFIQINKLKKNCGVILVDEAHKIIAPTYLKSLNYISNDRTKIIGLTATPGRETNETGKIGFSETRQLIEFFEGNKITLVDENNFEINDPVGYLQNSGFLAKIKRKVVKTDIELDLDVKEKEWLANFLELPQTILKKLADDVQRNALIISEIAEIYLKGHSCIVFALTVDHANLLNELLFVKGIPARCVDGDTSHLDRLTSIQDYKTGKIKILINYGVLTTGFDAPITKVVIITRPTASLVLYSQMVGRGIRGPKMGGNDECLLIDLKDNLVGFPDEKQAFNYYNDLWLER